METVISSLKGWPNPIRPSKTEVDANYLCLLERGLMPENARVLHLGVASHNLFSIAYAYLLAQKYGTTGYMTFEMLEGMAESAVNARQPGDSIYSGSEKRTFPERRLLSCPSHGRKYSTRQFPDSLLQSETGYKRVGLPRKAV